MDPKDYQTRTLDAFDRWLKVLAEAEEDALDNVERLTRRGRPVNDEHRNYPRHAWEQLANDGELPPGAGEYVGRRDGAGRPIPHVCFKVPTGGGKTFLAVKALARLRRPRGLVLWLMPTRAIYEQTKEALRNKAHPYRVVLDNAAGGSVNLLEKDARFSPNDVADSLCVMLLMLQASNRQLGRERLLMNRNAGRYRPFFPDRDDPPANEALLDEHPDLERSEEDGAVIHSLTNVLKMLRPVVILDEAHKAYGRQAADQYARAISNFNPKYVIELSATPKRGISNLLVDIAGTELKAEQMIKSPVQVTPVPEAIDWRDTLREAHSELERLTDEAMDLDMSEGRYIRPIAVVRAERTGRNQRDNIRVHSLDVRDYLTGELDVPEYAIRIKSSETDELGREDLLSKDSQVRWIITKDALKEGWDCSFAYMLVLLDKTQAPTAITQLVGRVMRQPEARLTSRPMLNQCYVYCWTTDVSKAVQQVKNGLENEGLTGLSDDVVGRSGIGDVQSREVQRRTQFADTEIYLPKVLHQHGDRWRELDYEEHILPDIDWGSLQLPDSLTASSDAHELQTLALDVDGAITVSHGPRKLYPDKEVTLAYFTRQLASIVPNPWYASGLVQNLIQQMRTLGYCDDAIYDRRSDLARKLREGVIAQVEKLAERIFLDKRDAGVIRFDLEQIESNYPMPSRYRISVTQRDRALQRPFDQPLERNLFDWHREADFNSLERECAYCLDSHAAVTWWHRIAERQRHEYYLRGWLPQRIFPDFIAMAGERDAKPQLLVFESKGPHLRGNPDTTYKARVLSILETMFNSGKTSVRMGPDQGIFRLVFDKSEIVAALDGQDTP